MRLPRNPGHRSIQKRLRVSVLALKIAVGGLLTGAAAEAEVTVGAYLGKADTRDTSVGLSQPQGTDLTFEDVSWRDESFTGPIYYGLRFTYWLRRSPNWGFGADFTHAKMVAELDKEVAVSGTRDDAPVSGFEPLGDTFEALSFTHGHNLFTATGSYRWFVGSEGPGLEGSRWRPYIGLGLGIAVPHVEITVPESETYEYQLVGPAAQGFLGTELSITRRFSFFAEYKLTWADMQPDLVGGGTLEVQPWTNHLVLGALLSF